MVQRGQRRQPCQERCPAKDPVCVVRVQAYRLPFTRVERTCFSPYACRHPNPAEVVNEGGPCQLVGVRRGQTKLLRRPPHEHRNP